MPRVSAAHLTARREQILDAARACFLRKGFHATSMQDVIAEADLSVGAVYRYFKSKNDLIAAIVERYVELVGDTLAAPGTDPAHRLADGMRAAIDLIEENVGPDGILRLAIQVWAESLRDEAIAAMVRRVYGTMRANFTRVAQRAVDAGELPPGTDVEAVGSALLSLVIGYGLQRMLTGRPDPGSYERGLRALLPH
jgi:AcrR family transcriptional regulator